MIVKMMHDKGVKPEHAYMAAFGSIALSVVSWMTSRGKTNSPADKADRWGIFIGQWAPTFLGLGLALNTYEDD